MQRVAQEVQRELEVQEVLEVRVGLGYLVLKNDLSCPPPPTVVW